MGRQYPEEEYLSSWFSLRSCLRLPRRIFNCSRRGCAIKWCLIVISIGHLPEWALSWGINFHYLHPFNLRKDLLLDKNSRTVREDVEAKKKLRIKNMNRKPSLVCTAFYEIVVFINCHGRTMHSPRTRARGKPKWVQHHRIWAEQNEIPVSCRDIH